MEEDSKKKKNKRNKKKNKHSMTLEDKASIKDSESSYDDQNHATKIGQDINRRVYGEVSEAAVASNNVVEKVDADWNDDLANGNNALLEDKVKELLKERDENLLIMANQEEGIKQLNDEKIALLQKEAMLVARLGQVLKENDVIVRKENNLCEKIKELQTEKDVYMQKVNLFEESLMTLNNDNRKLQDQVIKLEALIQVLSEENRESTELVSSLQFQINILESNVTLHQVDACNKEALILGLSEEKRELTETVYSLQSQVNILERNITFHQVDAYKKETSGYENVDFQTEAIHIPLENSVLEEPEPVENVTAELDPLGVKTEDYSYVSLDSEASVTLPVVDAKISHHHPQNFAVKTESINIMRRSGSTESLEEIMMLSERNDEYEGNKDGESIVANSSEDVTAAGKIVQISLGEEENDKSLDVAAQTDEITDASLIDAPLIGAPFRFISFVARYVSGADLVKNNGSSI